MPRGLWDDAVAATKRELGIRAPAGVVESNRSACIELPPTSRVNLNGVAGVMVVLLLAGLLLFVAAVALAGMTFTGMLGPMRQAWAWPVGALVGAVLAILAAARRENACFRRIAPLPWEGSDVLHHEPVGIEHADTYRKFKFVADDLGVLYHDPTNGRLLLMTTSQCCCLCAADVVTMTKAEGGLGSGVRLDVKVGSATLSLALSARKDLFDAQNPAGKYDPKGYFLQRLRRTFDGVIPVANVYRRGAADDEYDDDGDDEYDDDDGDLPEAR